MTPALTTETKHGEQIAHEALREAEAAFETIRVILINELDDPCRLAFWRAVAARDQLRKLLGMEVAVQS